MDPAVIITAVASGALLFVVGLVKLGWDLRNKSKSSTPPPPPVPALPSPIVPDLSRDRADEITGRHELEEVLAEAHPDAVPARLDRLERASAQTLRHVGQISKGMADLATVAESLDLLAQIEALREKRDVDRREWSEDAVRTIVQESRERDLVIVERVADRLSQKIAEGLCEKVIEEMNKRYIVRARR